jgi:hypothetical protein
MALSLGSSLGPYERLLVFDVSEGWGPLCSFLDCPVPPGNFPRSNSHDEFWQKLGAGLDDQRSTSHVAANTTWP